MPAPSESGRGRPAEMAPRHPNSPPSTREVRMLTALEDKAATEHAPRSPDRDVGSDDDESLYSVDSHGARIGPYTPERGAPPSYEHVMLSPMPTEPPSTPPRLEHHCSYSGEGERGNRVLTLFLVRLHPFLDARDASARPLPRLADPKSPPLTPEMFPPPPPRPQAAPSTTRWASPSPTGSPRGACLSATRPASSDETTRFRRFAARATRSHSTVVRVNKPRIRHFSVVSERPRLVGPPSRRRPDPSSPSRDSQIRGDPRHVPRRAREAAHRARGVQGASSVLPRARARRNTPIVQSEASNAFQKNLTDVPFHPRSPRKPPLFFVETFRHFSNAGCRSRVPRSRRRGSPSSGAGGRAPPAPRRRVVRGARRGRQKRRVLGVLRRVPGPRRVRRSHGERARRHSPRRRERLRVPSPLRACRREEIVSLPAIVFVV